MRLIYFRRYPSTDVKLYICKVLWHKPMVHILGCQNVIKRRKKMFVVPTNNKYWRCANLNCIFQIITQDTMILKRVASFCIWGQWRTVLFFSSFDISSYVWRTHWYTPNSRIWGHTGYDECIRDIYLKSNIYKQWITIKIT